MKNFVLLVIVFIMAISMACCQKVDYTFDPNVSQLPYGVGYWDEDGFGNHRAVLTVDKPADYVVADIEWRRFDPDVNSKGLVVVGPTGSVKWSTFTMENKHGVVAFEAPKEGTYYVYYMPYNSSSAYSIEKTEYFPNNPTLTGVHIDLDKAPKAKVERIECRSETSKTHENYLYYPVDYDRDNFYSMYPMLITITPEELREYKNKHSKDDFTVFCEDRTNPIKMLHQIPYKWFKQGEIPKFKGTAQPNEIYTFQIGVFACYPIVDLKVTPSDFKGNTTIKAEDIHCINTGGIDYKGNPFTKKLKIAENDVQPLWFYVQMPKDAQGTYKGQVTISDGKQEKVCDITINIEGDSLPDGGVSESWRMSRISWLDSTKGIDEKVIPPFTPLKVAKNKVSLLNRSIEFSPYGFPTQVISNGINILQSPIEFTVFVKGKKEVLSLKSQKIIKSTEAQYIAEYISSNDKIELSNQITVDFDGVANFDVKVTALKDIDISDVQLFIPYNNKISKYAMGLGMRGGLAPDSWNYEWDNESAKFLWWVGDYDAGMQVKLEPRDHNYIIGAAFDKELLPKGWCNDFKGNVKVKAMSKSYNFTATGGEKNLKAGNSCQYDFRLLITPCKPFDENRYSYRIGGGAHANTQLIFHSQQGNAFINYPFVEHEYLKSLVEKVKDVDVKDEFVLSYPVNNLTTDRGSITLWVENENDWATQKFSTSLFWLYLYQDGKLQILQTGVPSNEKTLRAECFIGKEDSVIMSAKHHFIQPTSIPSGSWKIGEKHVITYAWDENSYKMYVDGEEVLNKGESVFLLKGAFQNIDILSSGGNYKGIRIDSDINLDTELKGGPNTILFDTFSQPLPNGTFAPEIGSPASIMGSIEIVDNYATSKDLGKKDLFTDVYYTSREVSNHLQEIWALRSLGDEIFSSKGFLYTAEGAKELTVQGGGYQWLYEQLQSGYIPAWHMKLQNGEHCAAISTKYDSRWLNFYVEGVDYLMKNIGIRGIYLDGIGYDRHTMKRVAKVMYNNRPDYSINYHCGNEYDYNERHASPLNTTMEHLPYVTSLWIGEMYDYNLGAPYWFTEITGIPFGLPGEELENAFSNCNPYRGMLYGISSGRNTMTAPGMYDFWDKWNIKDATVIGYWDRKPAVRLNNDMCLATVYKQKGKSLIAVASWGDKDQTVDIKVDYKALGLNPKNVKITTPYIRNYQMFGEYSSLNDITIPAGKGFIFEVKE
ncbi:MAG: hypothetical protein IJS60_06005 [Abditibacteriota bacterium]|nr:hypothetical protein [Abditibacteriota bacterium]